jgi:pSer/pThr/pTyr-binding forkhead associated (FHA) protein
VETPEKRLRLIRVGNLVGRNPACDLAISHPSISRQHCLLQLTERGLHVKDLDTTNGTRVNGIALKEGYVNVGDRLTIGHVHFMVEKE